jgi:hypothetical protein
VCRVVAVLATEVKGRGTREDRDQMVNWIDKEVN